MIQILKIKNWLLFLLIYFLPGTIVIPITYITADLMELPHSNGLLVWLASFFVCWYAWEFAIGNILSRYISPEQKFNKTLYNLFFTFKTFIVAYVLYLIATEPALDFVMVISLLPLYLFYIFFTWYIFYQNAKIIRAAELNRPVYFNDFFHYFFLQFVLPIGIWLIQSRINAVVNVKGSTSSDRYLK